MHAHAGSYVVSQNRSPRLRWDITVMSSRGRLCVCVCVCISCPRPLPLSLSLSLSLLGIVLAGVPDSQFSGAGRLCYPLSLQGNLNRQQGVTAQTATQGPRTPSQPSPYKQPSYFHSSCIFLHYPCILFFLSPLLFTVL